MATATITDTKVDIELAAGQTTHRVWNNVSGSAVYYVNAVPVNTGSTTGGFNVDASFEVTRVWRRLTVVEKKEFPQSQTATTESEFELHYEVKNVGTKKGKFRARIGKVA